MMTITQHKILIIDDNYDEVLITEKVISAMAFDFDIAIETAPSGEAGLSILKSEKELPSLNFLDLKMPGMGGINMLRQLRSDERLKYLQVVVLTNSSLEADRVEAMKAGADGFLHKAFDLDQFGKDLKSILESKLKN